MRLSSRRWLRALALLASFALGACAANPASTPTCTPACRAGFQCVNGACVSPCNPPCAANETCVTPPAGPMCMLNPAGDSGVADAAGMDGAALTDSANTEAAVGPEGSPSDAPSTGDGPVTADASGDAPSAPDAMDGSADSGRAPCGLVGQGCCNGYACAAGASCNAMMRCEAVVPEADECTTTGVCPAGQACGFGAYCSGGTRPCLRCITPIAGGLSAGMPCGGSVTTSCAANLCASGACRTACALGTMAGLTTCRSTDPQGVCAEYSSTSRLADGGLGPTTVFGACVHSCAREADCTGGQHCALLGQAVTDDYVTFCRSTVGTIPLGGRCLLNPTSRTDLSMYCSTAQGWQCVAQSTSATETMGYCSAFCSTDTDCPSVLPHCTTQSFYRPSGTGTFVPLRMCTL